MLDYYDIELPFMSTADYKGGYTRGVLMTDYSVRFTESGLVFHERSMVRWNLEHLTPVGVRV
jgi:hypothetical protein